MPTDEELKEQFLAKRGATVCPPADKRPPSWKDNPVYEFLARQTGGMKPGKGKGRKNGMNGCTSKPGGRGLHEHILNPAVYDAPLKVKE